MTDDIIAARREGRVLAAAHVYWKNTTLVARMRLTEMVVPIVLDDPTDRDILVALSSPSSHTHPRA